jgi:hypothetical protein
VNGRDLLILLIFEVLQSLMRIRATKVNPMFVFREFPQHGINVCNPEEATAKE